jgi:hypothetical protein
MKKYSKKKAEIIKLAETRGIKIKHNDILKAKPISKVCGHIKALGKYKIEDLLGR